MILLSRQAHTALSSCDASQQFCLLHAIISRLLHTGVSEESPSRQKELALAAYFCYVACYCKSLWHDCCTHHNYYPVQFLSKDNRRKELESDSKKGPTQVTQFLQSFIALVFQPFTNNLPCTVSVHLDVSISGKSKLRRLQSTRAMPQSWSS